MTEKTRLKIKGRRTALKLVERPFTTGFLGSLVLALFYVLVLSFSNSFDHAVAEFQRFWYLITPLVLLFGFQIGLFAYMAKQSTTAGKGSLAVTGGISGGAMVACCLHHLFEILPLIGLTGTALLLADYQASFLTIGIVSGISGTLWMLKNMQEHKLYRQEGIWNSLMNFNWILTAYIGLGTGIFVITIIVSRMIGDIL